MAQSDVPARPGHPQHTGSWRLAIGPVEMETSVRISSGGLLAIGAMVSGIILSVAPLVWTATSVARKRAEADPVKDRGGKTA